MSGVVREFEAKIVKYSVSEKKVYIVEDDGGSLIFNYDISCDASAHNQVSPVAKIYFFFDLKTKNCLLVMPGGIFSEHKFQCFTLKFFLEDDKPMFYVNLFLDIGMLLSRIKDEFSEKYAAILLDGIINDD